MLYFLSLNLYQGIQAEKLNLFQTTMTILGVSMALVGATLYAQKTRVDIDSHRSEVIWNKINIKGSQKKIISFSQIQSIVVETSRNQNIRLGRVAIIYDKKTHPLTQAYSNLNKSTELAKEIRSRVGLEVSKDSSVISSESIKHLVKNNRIIDATSLLRKNTDMSLVEARAIIKKIQREQKNKPS